MKRNTDLMNKGLKLIKPSSYPSGVTTKRNTDLMNKGLKLIKSLWSLLLRDFRKETLT